MSKVDCRGWIRRMQASRPVVTLSGVLLISALRHPPDRRLRRFVMDHQAPFLWVGSVAVFGIFFLVMRVLELWP